MNDVREVAERVRGKRTWSIEEIRAAIPKMRHELVDSVWRSYYGNRRRSTEGPTGWHQPPGAAAVHWFVSGWAFCGWGVLANAYGRPEDTDSVECPTCRRNIERTKAA